MIRPLLLGACLAILCGCTASRKISSNDGANATASDAPKEYKYRDMSSGRSLNR